MIARELARHYEVVARRPAGARGAISGQENNVSLVAARDVFMDAG